MKTFSFLSTAEARADHLRELSTQLHALDVTTVSLSEAEHEIPELELALTVYNRLAPDSTASADGKGFTSLAEERAEHLRNLSHHMRSLDWTRASVTEVDDEIPELDLAMTVYRRLTGEKGASSAAETADTVDEPAATVVEEPRPMPRWAMRSDGEAEAVPATSFSQFARQHLDTVTAEHHTESNGI